jgi:hypothetical protein
MNAAAKAVMTELPDIVIAYGISDEYRYIIFFKNAAWKADQWKFRLPQISCAVWEAVKVWLFLYSRLKKRGRKLMTAQQIGHHYRVILHGILCPPLGFILPRYSSLTAIA